MVDGITVAMAGEALVRVGFASVMGIFAAGISTWVYWRFSPQDRLTEMSDRVVDARLQLRRYDGTDVRVALGLTRQAIGLSLRQLGMIVGPALMAVIPVISVAYFVDSLADSTAGHATGWVPWLPVISFWTLLCLTTVALRIHFKIK